MSTTPNSNPGPAHPHPEPRSYPLMLRTWTFAWWKPALGIVLLLIMFFLAPLLLTPVLAIGVALDHEGSFADAFRDTATLEHVTWQGMLYLNLSLAALVPVTWGILRLVHWMRPRWLASVLPGFRWRFFWACFGVAIVAIVAQVVVGSMLPVDPNELGSAANEWTGQMVALAVVIALTTPLQAVGEEYAFRGYLLQAVGSFWSWVTEALGFEARRGQMVGAITGIVGSALVFAAAHGVQNLPLFLDRFTFGLMAGYVVYRTGGLEAGIAMHVWNNLIAFGFALTLGDIDDALTVTEVSWWNIPLTVTQNGVYLLLVLLLARRMRVRSTTDPVSELPPPPPGSTPVLLPSTPPV